MYRDQRGRYSGQSRFSTEGAPPERQAPGTEPPVPFAAPHRLEVDSGRLSSEKDLDKAKGELAATVSLIDKMATKGIIHDNAAARYKSRLQLSLNKTSTAA